MALSPTSTRAAFVLLRVIQSLNQAVGSLTLHTVTTAAVQAVQLPRPTLAVASIFRVAHTAARPGAEVGMVDQGAFGQGRAAHVKDTFAVFVWGEDVEAPTLLVVVLVGAKATLGLVV
jgi:hypothetical protein